MNKLKKLLWVIGGFVSLGFGIIGIILPILPTTPLLLLASVCFFRSSERLDKWFKGTNIYKNHLESFVENKAMTLKQKWSILLFADFMMMFPLIFTDKLVVRVVIVIAMIFKYYYFMFRIKTIKK